MKKHANEEEANANILSLTKHLIEFSAKLCRVDIYHEENFRVLRRLKLSRKQKAELRYPKWSTLVQVVYVVCSLNILLLFVMQFLYDSSLRQKQQRIQSGSYEGELEEELRVERKILRLIGAAYIDFNAISEVCYLYQLGFCILGYVQTRLYYRYFCPFNSSIIRNFLRPQREHRNFQLLIQDELERLLESEKIYLDYCLVRSRFRYTNSNAHWQSESQKVNVINVRKSCLVHLMLLKDVGHLQPLNKNSDWLRKLSIYYALINLSFIATGATVIGTFWLVLSFNYQNVQLFLEPLDVLVISELIILEIIAIISCGFYLSVVVTNYIDQIYYILKLIKQFKQLLEENIVSHERLMQLKLNSNNLQSDSTLFEAQLQASTLMNANLLFVVFQYKIFLRQLYSTMNSNRFIAFFALQAMMFPPVMMYIYSPYIPAQYKTYAICLGFWPITWIDLYLFPISYAFSRSLDLHRLLLSLLAHGVQVQTEIGSVYADHTLMLLEREISNSESPINRFSITMFGLSFTYSSLLKFHFWLSIIAIAVVLEVNQTPQLILSS